MTTTNDKLRNVDLAAIARDVLDMETLETRNRDGLDFHDMAVWSVREALEKAYAAGLEARTPCFGYDTS